MVRRGPARGWHPRNGALPPDPAAGPVHVPVLLEETVRALVTRPDGRYIDATLGLGGHAAAILEYAGPRARLLGVDADPDALAVAGVRLAGFGERAHLVQGNFSRLEQFAQSAGFVPAAGILFDLGVSSLQFGPAGRGFTIRWDQPLDMRMDPESPISARDIVNGYTEVELADIIYQNGEERRSRAIARAIIRARPIETTGQLARAVEQAVGGAGSRIHPATRTFQALRIVVNRELDSLTTALRAAHDLLDAPGGRLVVLSYHSLEDRIVKAFIREHARDCVCPPELPVCSCKHRATLRPVTHGAEMPDPDEIASNPRARSARLRVAERLAPAAR